MNFSLFTVPPRELSKVVNPPIPILLLRTLIPRLVTFQVRIVCYPYPDDNTFCQKKKNVLFWAGQNSQVEEPRNNITILSRTSLVLPFPVPKCKTQIINFIGQDLLFGTLELKNYSSEKLPRVSLGLEPCELLPFFSC